MSTEETDENIVLEIDNCSVIVKKQDLITNSDYFKAMFEGDYVEKTLKVIPLKGVDLKAMNIILKSLSDERCEDEDILTVLHTARMLQFRKIEEACLERITELLSAKTSLEIWLVTELLDIRPLCLKAKCLALEEFVMLRDSHSILQLTLQQLCSYLGHVNLKTDNEFSVFQTVMKWWYGNRKKYEEDPTKIILQILSCVDYNSLSNDHMKEIDIYPGLADNDEMKEILECLVQMHGGLVAKKYPENCIAIADKLLSCKSRFLASCPCILVNTRHDRNDVHSMVYYDWNTKKFRKFFDIDNLKYQLLEGCKFLGYKEYVFMYGGEYLIGRGKWNYNVWAFDCIRDRWEMKCMLPFPRRHFESCIVGTKLFITGGTSTFRVTQENTFWYDFKNETWSRQLRLPFFDRHFKCFCFANKYFIFSVSNKCGYFLADEELGNWMKIPVNMEDSLLKNLSVFEMFPYEDKFYIKGRDLIEFTASDDKITVSSVKSITDKDCDKMEVTICGDTVYTLYEYRLDFRVTFSLERYHMKTGCIDFIFDGFNRDNVILADGEHFKLGSTLKLFSFNHYSLVDTNEVINDSFM